MTFVALAAGILALSACSGSSSEESSKGHGLDKERGSSILGDFSGESSLVLTGESRTVHAGSGFPATYAAPYLEMWRSPSVMREVREATGVKYFNLAFIIDDKAGRCNAKINGDMDLSDPGWVSAINENRAAGGDVIASFGGAEGTELGLSCKSVPALKAQYKKVIDTLRLSRVDFDIEGDDTLPNKSANDRRNAALSELQQEYADSGKNLDVNYTLPVTPEGLTGIGLDLLKSARSHGVDVNLVNIMTMDYGNRPEMGRAAVSAASGLHRQLKTIWPKKSDAELWKMGGNTPMIGINDIEGEVFSIANANTLLDFAKKQGIQQLAFWAVGRDHDCSSGGNPKQNCSGVRQANWQFSKILNGVTSKTAPAPGPSVEGTPSATPSGKSTTFPSSGPTSSTPSAKPKGHGSSSPASSGPRHITGLVHCESGRPIVGVWVEAANASDSHFAAWRGIGDGAYADWWTDLPSDQSYSLHIGCGGTPASWASENKTAAYSGTSSSFSCNDIEGAPNRGKCTRK
ncbi:chitinase [Streptomyces sp. WAC 01325]|uniref:chitinase n=1 Tax=Streptomyces sp. WAC 01325 TaxID=2203202 RepID=UPI0021AFF1E2|nr:chitinase [Streptomyces sp. WAC 01325]